MELINKFIYNLCRELNVDSPKNMPETAKTPEPAARVKTTGCCLFIIPYVKPILAPVKPGRGGSYFYKVHT